MAVAISESGHRCEGSGGVNCTCRNGFTNDRLREKLSQ